MNMTRLIALALLAPAFAGAQQSPHPSPPATPSAMPLKVPAVRSFSLPNGIQVRLVEQHELGLDR